MSKTFEQRFEQVITHHAAGNKSEFARLTGKTPAQITDICKGRGKPTFDYLLTLNKKWNINLHWLLTGEKTLLDPHDAEQQEFVYVPKYNVQASAGHGAFVDKEDVVDYLAFRREWVHSSLHMNPSQLVVITATGDSMHPTIKEGDILLLDLEQQSVTRDGLYVLKFRGTLMAKRVQNAINGALNIMSDNPLYKTFTVLKEQLEEVETVGRVVWCGSQV